MIEPGKTLAQMRREYSQESLSESDVAPDPIDQFSVWMNEALQSDVVDATAMTLATVGADGRPAARVVLLKGFGQEGFVFYTNYKSKKAVDLDANPFGVLHFFWPALERQISISGMVGKTTPEESAAYFNMRPLESRLSAIASEQSKIIASRGVLEARLAELREQFRGSDPPAPPYWGGFRLAPDGFEFWQGRPNRLHDRIKYVAENGEWHIYRLSP